MIEVTSLIDNDYENAGNLYRIQVTTESYEEFLEAWEILLRLRNEQQERKRRQIYG